MNETEKLVTFLASLKYDDLTAEVIEQAKLHTLDAIGCALGGSMTKLGKTVIRMVEDSGNNPESTIIGDGRKTNSKDAAFINATLANALDYGDHSGECIIPSALAVGEKVNASGKEFLVAVVAAYDAAMRVNHYMRPSRERSKKVWSAGSYLPFGATIAAGKLLGLDKYQLMNAFGISGATAPVPSANKWGFDIRPVGWVKDALGHTALTGVWGALMAKQGFLGCRDILDGDLGFWIMAGSDKANFEVLTRGLGKEFRVVDTGYKPYSSCRMTHPTLDAVSQIIKENNLKAEDIKSIRVMSVWDLTQFFQAFTPPEIVDGEFSIPYTVTMIVMGVPRGPEWYEDSMLHNPKVLEFAKKVQVITDPEADARAGGAGAARSTVDVTTMNGKKISLYVEIAKGDAKNPMTEEELKNKFRSLASYVIDKRKAEKIIKTVDKLDDLSNINELTKLLYK